MKTTPHSLKIKVETEISFQRIGDLLCSGMEGGIGYWATIVGYIEPKERTFKYDETLYRHIEYPLNGGTVKIDTGEKVNDSDKSSIYLLNFEAIKRGLAVMNEKYPYHMGNFLQDNEDAETGDVFIQCCLFGTVVYG